MRKEWTQRGRAETGKLVVERGGKRQAERHPAHSRTDFILGGSRQETYPRPVFAVVSQRGYPPRWNCLLRGDSSATPCDKGLVGIVSRGLRGT